MILNQDWIEYTHIHKIAVIEISISQLRGWRGEYRGLIIVKV